MLIESWTRPNPKSHTGYMGLSYYSVIRPPLVVGGGEREKERQKEDGSGGARVVRRRVTDRFQFQEPASRNKSIHEPQGYRGLPCSLPPTFNCLLYRNTMMIGKSPLPKDSNRQSPITMLDSISMEHLQLHHTSYRTLFIIIVVAICTILRFDNRLLQQQQA